MTPVPGLLAVIDMQRVFADPASPWATPRYAEAAAGVVRLLPAFGGRVVFTRFLAPTRPAGVWRAYDELDLYRPLVRVTTVDALLAGSCRELRSGPGQGSEPGAGRGGLCPP